MSYDKLLRELARFVALERYIETRRIPTYPVARYHAELRHLSDLGIDHAAFRVDDRLAHIDRSALLPKLREAINSIQDLIDRYRDPPDTIGLRSP